MGAQLAAANAGALICPPLFGLITRYMGVGLLPYYMALIFVLMCSALFLYLKRTAAE